MTATIAPPESRPDTPPQSLIKLDRPCQRFGADRVERLVALATLGTAAGVRMIVQQRS